MVTDSLDNASNYEGLHKRFKTAFDFIRRSDLKELELGRYEIDGKDVYCSISEYDTLPVDMGKLETHRLYIDIQCVLEGEEYIGYTFVNKLTSASPYRNDIDIEFLTGECSKVKLAKNDFMIVFPHDAHMPRISTKKESSRVKKCNIKVLM